MPLPRHGEPVSLRRPADHSLRQHGEHSFRNSWSRAYDATGSGKEICRFCDPPARLLCCEKDGVARVPPGHPASRQLVAHGSVRKRPNGTSQKTGLHRRRRRVRKVMRPQRVRKVMRRQRVRRVMRPRRPTMIWPANGGLGRVAAQVGVVARCFLARSAMAHNPRVARA